MDFLNKAKDMIDQNDEQVDQALQQAGEFAKAKFPGQEQAIDTAIDKAQELTGQGDTTRPAAPAAPPADQPPA
jgi:hypothetical protein